MHGRRSRPGLASSIALALSVTLAGTLAGSLVASPARADEPSEPELVVARQLFKEGKDLEAKHAWQDALSKFRKVGEVKMTPQVRFHIALCEENLGHLVAAINGFERAADEARRTGPSAKDVSDNAPIRAEALRSRVPTVRLVVDGTLYDSEILLDGKPIARALVGTDIPVDPGAHAVKVVNEGEVGFEKKIDLAEGKHEVLRIPVHDEPTETKESSAPASPSTLAKDRAGGSSKTPAIVAGVVGIASFAAAGVFLGLRASTIGEISDTCAQEDAQCDPQKRDVADRGQTYTTMANVFTGVGAAGLATAGVLWFVLDTNDPPKKQGSSTNAVEFGIAPFGSGARLIGSF